MLKNASLNNLRKGYLPPKERFDETTMAGLDGTLLNTQIKQTHSYVT